MIQVKLGTKGELVIPKKIREHLGLSRGRMVMIEVKDKSIEIHAQREDVAGKWEALAKKEHVDVRNWKYGDELYEEIF